MKDEYLNYLDAVRGLSENTRLAYRRDLDAWEEFLTVRATETTKADNRIIGEFLRSLGEQGLSPRSVNRVLSCLRGFYRFLLRSGRTSVNPLSGVRSLKMPRRLPSFLFEKEMQAVLAGDGKSFQETRDRFLFELLYSTGCRLAEVCSLTIKQVNGHSRFSVIGKGQKARWVFMTTSAQRALADYLPRRTERADRTAGDALLLNARGFPLGPRGIQKIVQRASLRAGITKKATPHTFRHTFATHLSSEGMDVRVVQELLGHSRLETTQIYTHLSLDRLKDIVRVAHPHG